MRNILLLITAFLFCNTLLFADIPSIYCEVNTDNYNSILIKSHMFWNVGYDKSVKVPKSYITGNNTTIVKDYMLGKNRIHLEMFFPEKRNGRGLNPSTTVHVTIFFNGAQILKTEHFGQHSEDFVSYNTDILCRPNIIRLYYDNNNDLKVNVMGNYIPLMRDNNGKSIPGIKEERFKLTYPTKLLPVSDVNFSKDVIKNSNANNNRARYNNRIPSINRRSSVSSSNSILFDKNKYYRLTTMFTGKGKSLDIVNDHIDNKLQLATTGNYSGQYWRIEKLNNGYYRLTTKFKGKGMSLDVVNDDKDNKLQLAITGNYTGQYWKIEKLKNGYYRLTTKFTGENKSLDVINDSKDNKLQLSKTGNYTGQYWKITEIN